MKKVHGKLSGNRRHKLVIICIVCVLAILIIFRWQQQSKEYAFSGSVMGTTYHVKYISKRLSEEKQKQIADSVAKALHRVDDAMSTYKSSSELMKLNAWPENKPFPASRDLVELLETSIKISKLSNGAYDVTVGPLVNLWGFGPDQSNLLGNSPDFIAWQEGKGKAHLPSVSAIAKAKSEIGYQYLAIDLKRMTVTKKKNLFIDLSSIAKGYGVDQAAKALDKLAIHNYMVEVGGEVHVAGYGLDHRPWSIAIRSPESSIERPYKIIHLDNEGLATSGDYMNYYDVNNVRYSHEINPRTGYPEHNNIASVTVIAQNTALADAYATMFMILKPGNGQKLAKQHNLAVYIIYRKPDNKGFSTFSSPAFTHYISREGEVRS